MPAPQPNGAESAASASNDQGEAVMVDMSPRVRRTIEAAMLRDLRECLETACDSVAELVDHDEGFHAYPRGVDTYSHVCWVEEAFAALRDLGWTAAKIEAEHQALTEEDEK